MSSGRTPENQLTEDTHIEMASSAGTAGDGSRGPRALLKRTARFARRDPAGAALLAAATLASAMLAVSEALPVARVELAAGSCEVINDANPALADRCVVSGFEQHAGAMLLIALVAAVMALGATVGRSLPASVATGALGLVALLLTLLIDLPETTRTGAIGSDYEGAVGKAGIGFYIELVAALAILALGVATFTRNRRNGSSARRPSRAQADPARTGERELRAQESSG